MSGGALARRITSSAAPAAVISGSLRRDDRSISSSDSFPNATIHQAEWRV